MKCRVRTGKVRAIGNVFQDFSSFDLFDNTSGEFSLVPK